MTALAAALSLTTVSSTASNNSSGCNNEAAYSLPPTYGTNFPREEATASNTSSSSSTPSDKNGSNSSRVRCGPRAIATVTNFRAASTREDKSSPRSFSTVARASSSSTDSTASPSTSIASPPPSSLFKGLSSEGARIGAGSRGAASGLIVPMIVPVSVTSGISGGGGALFILAMRFYWIGRCARLTQLRPVTALFRSLYPVFDFRHLTLEVGSEGR
mmetsp:Transcript_34735/g.73992  ORF Transcript_34735/g.73992 Transcript_34735/m.73992 type:complete len:216 (-) Transcript_34735:23-670(-)